MSNQDLDKLARMYADDFDMRFGVDSPESQDDGLSLEELSAAYAQVIQSPRLHVEPQAATPSHGIDENVDRDDEPVTPLSILEAVLFVGRPDSGPITATEIASLMRGVTETDVDQLIAELNCDYVENHRAFFVASVGGGYRLQLAADLEPIHKSFLGPMRPARLSQLAIDCLSLISYQPGISREKLDEQLGKPAGAILNQLVRRELLEIRRERDRQQAGNKLIARYFPTQRFLDLAGLESLDDLPTAEEWIDRE